MAKEFGSGEPPDLVKLEIERSRQRLARDVRGLRYEIDIPARIRRSFQRQTAVWVVAAVVVGVAAVALPRAGKKIYVDVDPSGKRKSKILETGFLLGAVRIAATLLKPVLLNFIRSRMAGGRGSSQGPAGKW